MLHHLELLQKTALVICLGADQLLMELACLLTPPQPLLRPAPQFKKRRLVRMVLFQEHSKFKAVPMDVLHPQFRGLRTAVQIQAPPSRTGEAEASPILRVGLLERETSRAAMELGASREGAARQLVVAPAWEGTAGITEVQVLVATRYAPEGEGVIQLARIAMQVNRELTRIANRC